MSVRRDRSRWLASAASCLVLGLYVLVTAPMLAISAPCTGGTERTVFGKWKTVAAADSTLNASKRKSIVVAPTNTRYLRVLIDLQEVGGDSWALTIRDGNQHVLQTMGSSDFADKKDVLTNRLATSSLTLELTAEDAEFPTLQLRQQIMMPDAVEGVPYYSRKTEGVEDWTALYDPTISVTQRKLGDNVAFLMVGLNEGSQPATCSGIALPPDLLLTNWHCGPKFNGAGDELPNAFWGQSICDRTLADLSWDDDKISREFACEAVLAKSHDLDYALLRIRAIDTSRAIGPVVISLKTDANTVSMVHHPAASKKVISKNCNVKDHDLPSWQGETLNATFSHDCDSEGGSSGAPVFDNSGALLGLHHLGFELDPANGQCDKKNKAIWFSSILNDLKNKSDAGEEKVSAEDIRAIEALVGP